MQQILALVVGQAGVQTSVLDKKNQHLLAYFDVGFLEDAPEVHLRECLGTFEFRPVSQRVLGQSQVTLGHGDSQTLVEVLARPRACFYELEQELYDPLVFAVRGLEQKEFHDVGVVVVVVKDVLVFQKHVGERLGVAVFYRTLQTLFQNTEGCHGFFLLVIHFSMEQTTLYTGKTIFMVLFSEAGVGASW